MAKDYKDAVLVFQKSVQDHHASIFSGKAYSFNNTNINGHPFIFSDDWQTGDIFINGRVFFDQELKLDIYKDVLILNHQGKGSIRNAMIIDTDVLIGARIKEKYFINISKDVANTLNLKEGIYEQVYAERSNILLKHYKTIVRNLKYGTDLYEEFTSNTNYYVVCRGKASMINTRKALMHALSEHHKEVKRFMKENRIKYSKHNLEDIIKIIRFYDSLDS